MAYASLDQVFVFEHPSQLVPPDEGGHCAAEFITCWSDGRLNFKRADVAVMREVFGGVLDETEIAELAGFARDNPDCHLSEALKPMALKKEQLDELARTLTDMSRCHSVWTVAEGRTRKWYRLCVVRSGGTGAGSGQRWVFEW